MNKIEKLLYVNVVEDYILFKTICMLYWYGDPYYIGCVSIWLCRATYAPYSHKLDTLQLLDPYRVRIN